MMGSDWTTAPNFDGAAALSDVRRIVMMGSYADDRTDPVTWDPAEDG